MDPLGATGTIVSVLQLSLDIFKYIVGVAGATNERRRLRDEIVGCESVLLQLQDYAEDLGVEKVHCGNIEAIEGPTTPLSRLKIALQGIKRRLEPEKRSQKILSALKWPFNHDELENVISAIQREKSLLQLVLANNCRELIKETKKSSGENGRLLVEISRRMDKELAQDQRQFERLDSAVVGLGESQGHIKEVLLDLQGHRANSKQQSVLNCITPIDFAPQQKSLVSQRQPGTGEWLLDSAEFQGWIASESKTLFCPGIPGAGKTILTSIVVDNLHSNFFDDPNIGIAYIYCNFWHKREQKPKDLLSILLKQLAQKRLSLLDSLGLFREYHEYQSQISLEEISRALHSVVSTYARVFIIIDALDEHETSTWYSSPLLSEIFFLRNNFGANVFATSRYIPEIIEKFQDSMLLEIRATEQDICTYIDSHILYLPSFVLRNTALKLEIKNRIVKAVDGMFLLAQLHLNSLVGKRSPKSVRTALARLPASPDAYKHAYENAMRRIEGQVPDRAELAKQVLCWVTFAKRPLTVLELQHALAVEVSESNLDEDNLPQIEDIISSSAGLVMVDHASGIVRLAHYTAQEYFEQTQSQWFPDVQVYLTTICITYLKFENFDNGFCKTDAEFEERLQSNHLYDYAARHWGYHAYSNASKMNPLLLNFLKMESKVSACSQAMITARDSRHENYSQDMPRQITGLHLATYFGLVDTIEALLENCNDADPKDSHGRTPLSYAAERGYGDVVTLLLSKHDIDLDPKDILQGWTPLWYAISGAHSVIVSQLLKQNAVNPDFPSNSGRTPLSWAAANGLEGMVRLLLEDGRVDLNSTDSKYGWTPLAWAAANGHETIVKLLLNKAGVNLNSRDFEYGRTPLSWAAERGHRAVVEALIAKDGIDLNSRSKYGRTPLWFSKERGHKAISKLLSSNNAASPDYKHTEFNDIPLWYAAETGQVLMMEMLLDGGASPNIKSDHGRTPLSYAAERGDEAMVRLLLTNSHIEPNSKDIEYGRVPLSWAAANGHLSVVKLLLMDDNVHPDSKSYNGRTPLSWASRCGHEAVAKLLLSSEKVDPDSKDRTGRTPLSHAAEKGQHAIVQLLLEDSRVSLCSRDSEYVRTPLLWASVNNHKAVAELLTQKVFQD